MRYRYLPLILLLLLYSGVVTAYSYTIPFSKGPDEYINYQYILFIIRHRHLPQTIAQKEEAGVKADWQPLYHLLAGMAGRSIPLEAPPELKVTWEPATRQLIDLVLPRATLVRTEDERPPYRSVYAVWQVGRWVSMLLGAGVLIVAYWTALTLWPQQPWPAVAVTAWLVFNPRYLFTHAVLSDDTLLGLCLAVFLLLLVKVIVRLNQPDRRGKNLAWFFTGMGLMAGLAVVTKYTAAPAVAAGLLSVAWLSRQQGWSWQRGLKFSALFLGGFLATAGWWVGWVWWHFHQIEQLGPVWGLIKPLLPGSTVDDNPTTSRLTALLTGQAVSALGEAPGAGGNLLDWAWNTFATYWGVTVFGAEPAWPYPYLVILIVMAGLCLLAVLGLGRVYRQPTPVVWQLLTLHVLVFFPLPLLRFILSRRLNDAAQGRHLLFPAGVAITILLVAGALSWLRPRWQNRLLLASSGVIIAWSLGHLLYLYGAYPPPLPVRTTPGPQVQLEHPLQLQFGNALRLTAYQAALIEEGRVLKLELAWECLAQVWEDYDTEIRLVKAQNQLQAATPVTGNGALHWLSQPAGGRFPVRAWQPGDRVRDTLYIPLVGLAAGNYELQLRLRNREGSFVLPDDEGIKLTTLSLEATPAPAELTVWQAATPFTGRRGWGLEPGVYRYRSTLAVTSPTPGEVVLTGPEGQPRLPTTQAGHLTTFIVDYDWPSGPYRVHSPRAGEDYVEIKVVNFDSLPGGWTFTLPELKTTVKANFGGKIELLGYDLPSRRVKAGEGLPLVLYWRGLSQIREDYTMFVQLVDENLQRRGGYDRFPRENYNTYLWVPGEVVDDGFAVPVEAEAPPGVYRVRLGWYLKREGQFTPLPLLQDGQEIAESSVVIGPIKVDGPPAGVVVEAAHPQHSLAADLGSIVRLLGYDLSQEAEKLSLTLYWQSLTSTETNYTVFVHLRDEAGNSLAQADGPPVGGRYPTSLWDPGEIIPDTFMITLPQTSEVMRYELAVGLYDPATGVRLTIPGTVDNSLILKEVQLK